MSSMTATLVALVVLALPNAVIADTYTVTRTDDPAPAACTANDCSLREAVLRANKHKGEDRLVLPDESYALSIAGGNEEEGQTGDLDVTGPTEIRGRGTPTSAVDGNVLDRVFDLRSRVELSNLFIFSGGAASSGGAGGGINISSNKPVAIDRSTITANFAAVGGGIFTNGNGRVTISRSVVQENHASSFAGGIRNFGGGVTEIVNSRVIGNDSVGVAGGVISEANVPQEDPSRLVVSKSTIGGNEAGTTGGGIFAAGRVDVSRSTVSNNDAVSGAGIYVAGPTLNLTNSTVAGNDAIEDGGGIFTFGSGQVRLNAATVAFNTADDDGLGAFDGAGIRHEALGEFRLDNSLIAANELGAAGGEPDCSAAAGAFVSGGHNLIGEDAGCDGLIGSDIVDVDAMLDPLSDYGGPTDTVRVQAGSPAINEGGKDAPKVDQRGHKRGKKPDIGAFER